MKIELKKLNELFDEASATWHAKYEAPGLEGCAVSAIVPREIQDPGAVARYFLQAGAKLPLGPERRLLLTTAINSDAPIIHQAARTGWRDDHRLFVSHRYVAGIRSAGPKVVPPAGAASGITGQLEINGDLEGWQELAALGRYSTAITVALCAAFAAPLLTLAHRPSFALVLVGPSRCGKSTAQLVGASVLGFGREEDLPTLKATDAGLLAAALTFNDHMLPINEVGTARGSKRDVYDAVREVTYALTSGQDIIRHPSWVGNATGAPSNFQVLPLLSSEHSPEAWAARNGEARDEGETARLIGVPVLWPRRKTIFDCYPKDLKRKSRENWRREQFQKLRQGLPNHRGVAFRAYLDLLAGKPAKAARRALKLASQFEADVITSDMSAVSRDIVSKFGVLYAGGVIASEQDILPISERRIGACIKRACLAALSELPDPLSELKDDLRTLKENSSSGSVIDRDKCSKKQLCLMRQADGYHEIENGRLRVVVRAQVFARWFGTPLRTRRVLEWLDDEGLLQHSRNRSNGRSNEWAQQQVTWPDGTRQRSIHILLPNGFEDIALPHNLPSRAASHVVSAPLQARRAGSP